LETTASGSIKSNNQAKQLFHALRLTSEAVLIYKNSFLKKTIFSGLL
jgi:hypothetical protein